MAGIAYCKAVKIQIMCRYFPLHVVYFQLLISPNTSTALRSTVCCHQTRLIKTTSEQLLQPILSSLKQAPLS